MHMTGQVKAWLQGAEEHVKDIVGEGNPLLFEYLLKASGFKDVGAIRQLRNGARFIGQLESCGLGEPIQGGDVPDLDELKKRRRQHNEALLVQMKEEKNDA
eukprot:7004260-Karenia_brevis.AAC.1